MRKKIWPWYILKHAVLSCCVLLALAGAVAAQTDKAGYEKDMEHKAERAMETLLGPGKAVVTVRVPVDFQTGVQDKPVTVFVALSDSVTDADAAKVRDTITRLFGLAAERGDEVVVMKPGTASGRDDRENTGGLGRYAPQGFWVLVGIFVAGVISRIRKAVAEVKTASAARVPPQPLAPSQYVPPPVPAKPAPGDDDDLNIPSRSGFYKSR